MRQAQLSTGSLTCWTILRQKPGTSKDSTGSSCGHPSSTPVGFDEMELTCRHHKVGTSDSTLLIVLAVIALVGPIVTAAATLIAVQLSSRGERLREQERHQQERARWHLELRTNAYSKLLETADHF